MKRLHYLDNLRILLSILVVLHHVGIGYGTMGDWCYISTDTMQGFLPRFLSGLFGIEATFSMSLFFFISAYLTPYSLDKKGAEKFIKRQLLRLGVPLLFVMILFAPSVLYFIEWYKQTTQVSWLSYIWQQNINSPTTSHAWFILVLILFEAIYVFYWQYIRPHLTISALINNKIPSHIQIALGVIMLSVLTLMVRQFYPIGNNFIGLHFANFVFYTSMYALGILISRKNWLDLFIDKVGNTWFLVSIPFAVLFSYLINKVILNPPFISNFIYGLHLESAGLAVMETIICFGFSGFLLRIFRKKLDFTNPVLAKMTETRYGVYIFHSAIVVAITISLEFISILPSIKFGIASILSVAFSFLFVGLIRKIKFVEKVI